MPTTKEKKNSTHGFQADFKPPREKRTIRFASDKAVAKAASKSLKEFSAVFKKLAE